MAARSTTTRAGVSLPDEHAAKARAFEIVNRLVVGTQRSKNESRDLLCTIRDVGGHPIMKIKVESGARQ